MKFFFLSTVSGLLLFSFSSLKPIKQNEKVPAIKVAYHPVSVAKLDPETDTIVETWKTNNTCTFQTDTKKLLFSFKEVDEKKKDVRSYSYPITGFKQDEQTYQFTLQTDVGMANYIVWKDQRMVVIEAEDYNYIISK